MFINKKKREQSKTILKTKSLQHTHTSINRKVNPLWHLKAFIHNWYLHIYIYHHKEYLEN